MNALPRPTTPLRPAGGPFDLQDGNAYRSWRAERLSRAPRCPADLIVPITDPMHLTATEHAALADRIARSDMAVYQMRPTSGEPLEIDGRRIAREMGRRFGLVRLDANWLADEDGLSPIAVSAERGGSRGAFIPYTNRAIKWHTDGYYHPDARRIRGMVLHCVRPAAAGGGNALLDPALAYIALRDLDPRHVAALSDPGVMTIPARTDEEGVARAAQSGPVFSIDEDGALHMRYTARTRSIVWKDDEATRAAVAALERVLAESPHVIRVRLESGMGLLSNNVLHDRDGFVDDPAAPRLLIRARYLDRIDTASVGALDPSAH